DLRFLRCLWNCITCIASKFLHPGRLSTGNAKIHTEEVPGLFDALCSIVDGWIPVVLGGTGRKRRSARASSSKSQRYSQRTVCSGLGGKAESSVTKAVLNRSLIPATTYLAHLGRERGI